MTWKSWWFRLILLLGDPIIVVIVIMIMVFGLGVHNDCHQVSGGWRRGCHCWRSCSGLGEFTQILHFGQKCTNLQCLSLFAITSNNDQHFPTLSTSLRYTFQLKNTKVHLHLYWTDTGTNTISVSDYQVSMSQHFSSNICFSNTMKLFLQQNQFL